jgi:hypothetical protein
MSKCEHCETELMNHQPVAFRPYYGENDGKGGDGHPLHTEARCRDALKAKLDEVEQAHEDELHKLVNDALALAMRAEKVERERDEADARWTESEKVWSDVKKYLMDGRLEEAKRADLAERKLLIAKDGLADVRRFAPQTVNRYLSRIEAIRSA